MSLRTNFAQLDGLRAVAAMSVFTHHIFQQYYDSSSTDALSSLFRHLGAWGVAVFFALSGFCIHWASLLQKERNGNFSQREYFCRRFLRIYPAFSACLILCLALGQLRTSNLLPQSLPQAIAMHFFLLSSFFPSFRVGVNNVLWSVVLEVQFYILYGLFWKNFIELRGVIISTVFATILSAATFLASVTILAPGDERVMLQHTFLATFWAWCLGAIVAQVVKGQLNASARYSYATLNILIWGSSLAICLFPSGISLQLERFVLPFLVALGLYFMVAGKGGILVSEPFQWLGRSSYSLYLFHPVALWVVLEFPVPTTAKVILTFCFGLLLAPISYRLFERPFMKVHVRMQSSKFFS